MNPKAVNYKMAIHNCLAFSMITTKILNTASFLHLFVVLLTASICTSCSRAKHQSEIISAAEQVVYENPDSALTLLNDIDPLEIETDSLKAAYYLLKASAHKANGNSMDPDSLVRFSFEFYKNHDNNRFVQSAGLYASHLFWAGDKKGAIDLVDSVASLKDIPDSLMIALLSTRIEVGGTGFDCEGNIAAIKRLQSLDRNPENQIEYKYQLCENYQLAGYYDEALATIEALIDYAGINHLKDVRHQYEYEKIGILEELGRYDESNMLADYFLSHASDSTAIPFLHFWKALNYFNMGNHPQASRELSLADSCAVHLNAADKNYYESFAVPLRGFMEFRQTGAIRLSQFAILNNARHKQFSRMEATRQETGRNMLRQENRNLILKSQNQHKTAVIIIVVLAAIIIALTAYWNIQKRKRKTIEAEERAETLQNMIDEMKSPQTGRDTADALRKAMLQQLGIIKMVAETPTEQNREMLRKISSVQSGTRDALVNWQNVFDIIDNLYSGFYSRLHKLYGDILTDRELQIIVLMVADFSTKEISVVTSQSTATVYVRKTSIRKKLGVPGKEDIVAFLRNVMNF